MCDIDKRHGSVYAFAIAFFYTRIPKKGTHVDADICSILP